MKKLVTFLMISVMALCLAACGDSNETENKATATPKATEAPKTEENAATETEEDAEARDLGGQTIVIADWWSGNEEGTDESNYRITDTTYQEEYWDYQDEMMEKYNYKLIRQTKSSWADMAQDAMLSITTNNPLGDIIVLDSGSVASLLDKGMFADVSNVSEFDFSDEKWNQAVLEVMTVGDAVYGFAGSTEPRTGVFYNKELFKQAGLDENLPYTMQADGTWTFENFTDLCKKLCMDTDNDGTYDVYAIASFSADFFAAALLANGTDVITKADDGSLMVNTSDPAVLEALNWGRELYDLGYHMPQPEDSEWNWFVKAFQEGQVAMRVCEEYNVSEINQYDFDFGFVCFPQGPSADSLISIVRENILVIPSCFDDQHISDTAFAYNIYTSDVPGYEDDDTAWKASYETLFKDEQAVSETLNNMINVLPQKMSSTILLPDYAKDWCYSIDAGSATPAEVMEEYTSQWDAMVSEFNEKFN